MWLWTTSCFVNIMIEFFYESVTFLLFSLVCVSLRVTLVYRMVICVFRFCIPQLMTPRVESCPVKGGILPRMLGTLMFKCSCYIDCETSI